MSVLAAGPETSEAFRHEALFYDGPEGFLDGIVPFVREGIEAREPVLVAVPGDRRELLRCALGDDAATVAFLDMEEVGRNPGRIIGAWRDFVATRGLPGSRLRGVGEPVWPGRTAYELAECRRHEMLLNLAFADTDGFWLLCPYDAAALGEAVVRDARCSHPLVTERGMSRPSDAYRGLTAALAPFEEPLSDPPAGVVTLAFEASTLGDVRRMLAEHAAAAGIQAPRVDDLLLAVSEIAANSVRHAGGRGSLRAWRVPGELICEVRDAGRIGDPLAGRFPPPVPRAGGYGLWLANQLCDLVQIRTSSAGTVVRVHMAAG